MKMLNNIIRGGQLSLHALRMFRQVCMVLISWCLVVWLLLFGLMFVPKIDKQYIQAYADYHIASALKAVGLHKQTVSVNHFGTKTSYVPNTILTSPYFVQRANYINSKLSESAKSASNIIIWVFLSLSLYFIYRGFKKSGEQFKRGANITDAKDLRQQIKRQNFWSSDSYTLANMPYPKDTETSHTLIIGATGVGKTVLISDLVSQIRKRGDRAIIFDKKCDFTSWFYDHSKDFILNPFDTRGVKWNLLNELEHISQIKTISECFIPNKGYYSGDKVWDEAAKIVFSSIVEKLYATQNDLSNRDIADKILKQNMTQIAKLVKGTYAESIIDLNSPKTASSVLFVLATYFNSLRIDNAKKADSFSIRNWIKSSDDSILFINATHDLESDLKPLQTVWFEIVISGILSSNNTKRKTWVILDELPTLQRIPSLPQGLAVSRSYGGCFVLGMQNIAQMKDIYGLNGTQSISAECNTRCIFRTNDPDTAKWMSDNIGQRETKEYVEGLSYGASEIRDGISLSQQEKTKHLVLPSGIQNLSNLELYLKMPNHPITKTNVEYKERAIKAEKFVRNEELDLLSIVKKEEKDEDGDEGDNSEGEGFENPELLRNKNPKNTAKQNSYSL